MYKCFSRCIFAFSLLLCLFFSFFRFPYVAAKNSEGETECTSDGVLVHITDQPEEVAINTDTGNPFHKEPVTIDTTTGEVQTRSGKPYSFGQVFHVSKTKERKIISGNRKKKRERIDSFLQEEEIYSVDSSKEESIEVAFPFVYKRIGVFIKQGSLKDSYGAIKACYYTPVQYYVLEYSTEEAAKEAFLRLVRDYGDDHVIPDLPVSIDEDEQEVESSQNFSKSQAFTETDALSVSYGVDMMHLDAIRDSINADPSFTQTVKVAVLDSGINSSHEMFAGRIADGGKSFLEEDEENPYTYEETKGKGHGTHVSGIIADGTPDVVKIIPIKVLDPDGNGTLLGIINALKYAKSLNVDIINMSFSLDLTKYSYSTISEAMQHKRVPEFEKILKELFDSGCPCIVSAGNQNHDINASGYYSYPTISSYAAAVSNIDANKEFEKGKSNYGSSVDFTAPGASIVGAAIGSETSYTEKSGTSMSAPHVSAACAVLKVFDKDLSTQDTLDLLSDMCEDLGDEGKDIYYGNGLITFGYVTLLTSRTNVYPDEEISFQIYAPGASKAAVYCDDNLIGETDGQQDSITWSSAKEGKYNFYVKALTGGMEYTSKTVSVRVSPLQDFEDTSEIPGTFYEGEDGIVTLRLPDGATGLTYHIYDATAPGNLNINPEETFTSDLTITIPGGKIIDGHIYRFEYVYKAGRGYKDYGAAKEVTASKKPLPTPGLFSENPTLSLAAYDKEIALKKGGDRTVTFFVTAKDQKKAVTDSLSAVPAKAGIVKVSDINLKGGKLTFKLKGLKAGTTTVNVKSGSKTASVKVTVVKKANSAKKVAASKKKVSMKKGGTKKLLVKITLKTGKYLCTDAITASSSKTSNATISAIAVKKGKAFVWVKGLKKGKSTITVKIGKKKAKIKLTVK